MTAERIYSMLLGLLIGVLFMFMLSVARDSWRDHQIALDAVAAFTAAKPCFPLASPTPE